MGSEMTELVIKQGNEITVFLMAGLQGAGKTTTCAKIAGQLKKKGKKPLLVACDVYRPAAIKQLEVNGAKQGVPVFTMGDKQNPIDIAKASIEHAKENDNNIVILDTAGRLHVDESMMEELQNIKANVDVTQTVLVVDAMTGQDAVNVAKTFEEKVGIDGVILTKVWVKSYQILSSFTRIVWHQEFLEWEMYLLLSRRRRMQWMRKKQES